VDDRGPFLPWVAVPEQAHREMHRWETRDLDPGTEPVTKRGGLVFARQALVYRPYWLARVLSDQGQAWVLVDGGFGTIGGYPSETESRALLDMTVADPEDAESRETKALVRPSRCPDCGFETVFDRRGRIVVCASCHLALEPRPEGVTVVPYDHAAEGVGEHEYLPFWAFDFEATIAGAPPLRSLEAYAKALHPRGLPPGFAPRGGRLLVPAFRLLGTEAGDECFKQLVERLHGSPPEPTGGKVPVGERSSFRAVTVAEAEARELLPYVLYALHDTTSAARLNTLLVRTAIDRVRLADSPARLVMVPFARSASGADSTWARIPRLLLDGGPELDAQRVTVERASAAAIP
jgi:hypothetical protein